MYTMFLEDFTYPLEKEMATHSSILAWKTPWTEEPAKKLVNDACGEDQTAGYQCFYSWLVS